MPRPRIPHERREAVLNAYAGGVLLKVIAHRHGYASTGLISKMVREARNAGDPRAALRYDIITANNRREDVVSAWGAGLTAPAIAAAQGISVGFAQLTIFQARQAGDPRAARRNSSARYQTSPEDGARVAAQGFLPPCAATVSASLLVPVHKATMQEQPR